MLESIVTAFLVHLPIHVKAIDVWIRDFRAHVVRVLLIPVSFGLTVQELILSH